MKGFEDAIGRQLFDRRARQVVLTREGQEICDRVDRILEQIDDLRITQDDSLDGVASIGSVVSVIGALSLAVAHLKSEHPGLQVRLSSARSNELEQMVHAGELDLAVVIDSPDGERSETLAWTPLYEEPLMLVTSSDVVETDPRQILDQRGFLRFDRRVPTGMIIDQAIRDLDLPIRDYLELNSIETIVSLVRDDIGVSILPALRNGNWLDDGRLKLVPLASTPFIRRVGMIHNKLQRRERLIQAIVEILRTPTTQIRRGR
jgi:DNA-binding transcriptional LysR family regulator